MKAYILSDDDFERLLSELDKNAEHGNVFTDDQRIIFNEAHRFYNYLIRRWIDKVKE
jgi:hypothetical protein